MKEYKDCLFIGHNETKFELYENMVRSMGTKSPAYRDLELSFVNYKNKVRTFTDIFNMCISGNAEEYKEKKFSLGNLFSPAIAYLGSFLERRGISFDFVNSFQDDIDEMEDKLKKSDYLAIIIPTTLYISPMPVMEIISTVKKYNKTAKIIVGGPFITTQVKIADSEDTLEYFFKSVNADIYINSSQGEAALANVIMALKDNKSLTGIDNIYYRSGSRFIKNSISIEDNRLEENPVNWNIFKDNIKDFAAVRTAISCPFSCKFCGFPEHAGKYQVVDVDVVEKELDLINSFGNNVSLNFIDDTLNVPPDRFKEILKVMIRNNYNIKWNSHYRCQFADEETVALMKESGCEGVFLGVESGDPQILKNMNKAATIEKYRDGIALLKKYNIISYASFIIGFPGETDETVKNTVNFINETKPDFFRTQLWYCDPTTPIWKEKEHYGIKGSLFQWKHNTMNIDHACDLIEEIFLTMESSVWVPQYNFDLNGIFTFLKKGLTISEITEIMRLFNTGIRERLNGTSKELREELMVELKKIIGRI